ncbi:carbonic anhydrase [Salisediminibacterium halotolerans]|uniref:carbonic anhydrase n=1 Tax=Salisediminibacterium halotolerans TaxID=517425 RepID=A0A1H9UI55_9BACI|nr:MULTISPECIES: carbonic anhydrase [Salisediminibacterium]RLJ69294.1 carbonic anhydrase [Actinophytocola xinjiangensis]RPE86971.1 carbonic anhydrase [Salisediminibacterium halotolerans]TWG32296.1 carbonic anhydrase [Salisediminibacterium halotolerans]SES08874.1 carbonic anhydrase [Salisediminibacterium haloalkalitolerans]GEL08809.1 hypothetical protein SHA02_22250 [Salisediminibacterium halotolerans]
MSTDNMQSGNRKFIERMKEIDPDFFKTSGAGQNPDYFVIACSDSRTDPETITSSLPGRIFSHRNIANQANVNDDSFRAGLYYALAALQVDAVIVLGHTGCGGIKAVKDGVDHAELAPWLAVIQNRLESQTADLENLSVGELEKLNIQAQVEHILSTSAYREAGSDIPVIGGLYHTESGEIEWL